MSTMVQDPFKLQNHLLQIYTWAYIVGCGLEMGGRLKEN